ncbi:hypothetical protein FKM82_022574 [Ascaphus truei]
METIWIRGQEWIWISDVKPEIRQKRPFREKKVRTRTKVVPFVPPDDEAGYEADDEAYEKAGVKWNNEVGYKAAEEADVVYDDQGAYDRCGRICCFTFFRRRRRPQEQVGEYERCGQICCFTFFRRRRSREQVAEEPGRRYRGILGALRSWFDRRRGR